MLFYFSQRSEDSKEASTETDSEEKSSEELLDKVSSRFFLRRLLDVSNGN